MRQPEAKRKRRAGLEPEAEKGRERCMQEGDVRCALVYKELEGVGIVEESQAEESGWRRALCDKLWLKAGGQVWRRYDTEHDSAMLTDAGAWATVEDPYLAVMVRYDQMEVAGGGGVVTSDGVHVTMDEEEVRTMARQGTVQTAEFVRRTVALHLTDKYTDVYATDGSKKGTKAAYGVWAGPGVLDIESVKGLERAETEEEVRGRVAAGMMGGRLPEGWDVTDAELAGVLRALMTARALDDGSAGGGRRVLVCTDSHAAMRLVENAWRKGRHGSERWDRVGLLAAIMEVRREICRERSGGGEPGLVKFVYSPAHKGIAPNAMADAIAKSYLDCKEVCVEVMDEVYRSAYHVRPYVYGTGLGGDAWGEMEDRRVSAQVRKGLMLWVRAKLGEGGRRLALPEGTWGAVVAAVGRGGGAGGKVVEGGEGDEGQQRAVQERKVRREELTYGVRAGDHSRGERLGMDGRAEFGVDGVPRRRAEEWRLR